MKIRLVEIRNFRGFQAAVIQPAEHVVLVGEPRAGRSDVLEALTRVFMPDATRLPLTDDLDFYNADLDQRPEVEVVIGDLGDELTQVFFDELEWWDLDEEELIAEADDVDELDELNVEQVIRLCYRAAWSVPDEHASQWVDFPKFSDPDQQIFQRVRRAQREVLPFFTGHAGGRPLSLSARAHLRRLVDAAPGDDFAASLEELAEGLVELAHGLASAEQMKSALESVLDPLRLSLDLTDEDVEDVFRFIPEGGALGGLLRSLTPTLALGDSDRFLPLSRHGSTAAALFAAAELVAAAGSGGVVAIDDFGEGLDADSARHLAATLRRRTAQLWLSTRRPGVAQAFRPGEVVRLAFDDDGERSVHHGADPRTRDERMASRHTGLQLLPAIASRAVAILEGPHDRAALTALSERLLEADAMPLPAARGIAFADAGAEGGGGASGLPRLASAATALGWFTIAVVDGDRGDEAEAELEAIEANADAVVRLPDGAAIERAILDGLTDEQIADALTAIGLNVPDELEGAELVKWAVRQLKKKGGLHAQFLDALPEGTHPRLAAEILGRLVDAATDRERGLIQL